MCSQLEVAYVVRELSIYCQYSVKVNTEYENAID